MNRDSGQSQMIFNWNASLISNALEGLTEPQRNALDLESRHPSVVKHSPTVLRKYGFADADAFNVALAEARMHTLAFFRVRGIRQSSDLEWAPVEMSFEGRIQLQRKGRSGDC